MHYHLHLELVQPVNDSVTRLGYSFDDLTNRVLTPYRNGDSFIISGQTIDPSNIKQIRISKSDRSGDELMAAARAEEANSRVVVMPSITDYVAWTLGEDVTDEIITAPPGNKSMASPGNFAAEWSGLGLDPIQLLGHLFRRVHLVAKQLEKRHSARSTIEINDEYDVQDLLHSLLRIFYDDIREEDYVPSYAGSNSRVDLLLRRERVVIEVKMTRDGLGAKEIGEQLIIDIARYAAHPNCETLLCLVYDPELRVKNPRGLEDDLSQQEGDLVVHVLVVPSGS